MKILLINKFHYRKGGSETYYFGLGELLEKSGHQVIYFAMKDERNIPCDQEKYFVENIDFNKKMSPLQMGKAGVKMLYSFEAKKKLAMLIKAEKPDIAHINLFQSQLTGSIVDVLHKHHIPIVYTMHDLKPICPTYLMMCHGEICHDCIYGDYRSCIRKHCMKNSWAKSVLAVAEAKLYRWKKTYDKMNLIITPSDHHKHWLEEAAVTKTPIVRMRNFLPENTPFAEQITAGKYFLYFGRISEEKGVVTLIKAYSKSHVESPLYIVGRGPLDEDIKKLVQDLNIQSKVKILGFKSGKGLQDIVIGAKCVILPSECCENAPYSILEAMAAGRPVIVSDNGGLPEIVTPSKNGFIFPARNVDELKQILEEVDCLDDLDLERMGRESLELVKKIADPVTYCNGLISIFQSLSHKEAAEPSLEKRNDSLQSKKIKRVLKRGTEELHATFKIASKTSISDAITVLLAKKDIQVLVRNGFHENKKITRRLLKKHEILNTYFDKTIATPKTPDYQYYNSLKSGMVGCIWVCWWQGLENAPDIVKKCVASIKEHAGEHKVIVITDQNYKKYVSIPAWVEEKRKKGIISKTHFSDILRLSLLAQHGGMWLDATFYCTSDKIQDYFKLPLWSVKRPGYAHASVAQGEFANFSWACSSENRWIFKILRDYLLTYWKKNNILIDYLVLDYLIVLAQNRNKEIKEAFNKIPVNNPDCDELLKLMNSEYSEMKMNSLTKNTCLFKLTWKQTFDICESDKKTFFGQLIS